MKLGKTFQFAHRYQDAANKFLEVQLIAGMTIRQAISAALITPACLFMVLLTGWLIYSWSTTRFSSRATGKVVQLVERRYSDSIVYFPVFTFTDNSNLEHTVRASSGSHPTRFPVGSTVSILYRKDNPSDAQIEDRLILWTHRRF